MKKETGSHATAYTDGSYNRANGCFGYGVVLYCNDKEYMFKGSGEAVNGGRQIEGELVAALTACIKALELNCSSVDILYDYKGVEM